MDPAKGSRLEKLLQLLEGGESGGIRDTAARQIATLAQAHPAQICCILRRVHSVLHSRRWDGRVAAGTCLSLLAEHFEHFSASDLAAAGGLPALQPEALEARCSADAQGHLRFSSFDVANLLRDGRVLLQSGGQEFQEDDRAMSSAERLQAQRKALNKRLKLAPQLESIMDTGELIDDEDLVAKPAPAQAAKKQGQSADEMLAQMSGLSARERNQLKRKLKQSGKAAAGAKRLKETVPAAQDAAEDAVSEEAEWQAVAIGQWPFQHLADQLLVDCLSSSWEVRHGATLALRDILSSQASSAAVPAPVSLTPSGWAAAEGSGRLQLQGCTAEVAQKAQVANALWVEDCCVHLLTVLALDRFGDYGSDQVVAPVRETAAQALGAASRALSGPKVAQVAELLCTLAAVDDWSVRHGGLLGLKYLLAARQDRADSLLHAAVPAALRGLQDCEDDVRAVAAEALLPVGSQLALRSDSLTATIETRLWDILLLDSGDLNLSTGSAMRLLACLYANGHKGQYGKLEPLLPRLWPYFRHTLAAVRLAVVQCLKSLLALGDGAVPWLTPPVLSRLLLLAFQNLLLEADGAVLQVSKEVWAGALQRSAAGALEQSSLARAVPDLFALAATVEGWAFDQKRLQSLSAAPGVAETGLPRPEVKAGDSGDALSMRFAAADAMGQLGALWTAGSSCPVAASIETHLASSSAAGRLLAALTAKAWVLHSSAASSGQQQQQRSTALPATVISALQKALQLPKSDRTPDGCLLKYAELGPMYQHTHSAATRLLTLCGAKGQDVRGLLAGLLPQQYAAMLTAENAKELATTLSSQDPEVAEARQLLLATAETLLNAENLLHISVTAMMAAALAQAGSLPPKLNGIIQPLMAALRRQASPQLRRAAAAGLAALILRTAKQNKNLATKVVSNVAGMVCGDPTETPRATDPDPEQLGPQLGPRSKSSSKVKAAPQPEVGEAAAVLATARQGGEAAMVAIAERFGASVLDDLPVLAEKVRVCLAARQTADAAETQAVLDSLQLLRVVGPALVPALQPELLAWLPQVLAWLRHHRSIVRASASKALAALTGSSPDALLPALLRQLVPMLARGESQAGRQGAIELVERLVSALREAMVPYLLLLVMPVMGCMADQDSSTRVAATAAFGKIVALLPLAQGLQPPDALDAGQREAWLRDADFLQELLDNSKVRPAELPAAITASLRPYQQEGLNWLAFLRRCGLHGILADDMGLGKTLQATATLTAAHQQARQAGQAERPSLVVCPQVLVGHWAFEIGKFVAAEALRPLAYEGNPQARAGLRAAAAQADVVIMSYETLRADVEWVTKRTWRYCVLDEGHIIRNPKAKITEAVKRVVAEHRLILTGTPIQNSVNELWALFDFLMPGFLGSEADFNAKYGKAYRSGRASSVGSKEAQAAFVAMEGLHKQVMPFILRRQKDAVLADLPPKIVQDVYCHMSPLQAELHNQFSSSAASQSVHGVLAARAAGQQAAGSEAKDAPHVFQALQYMRRLCSHPLMVLQASLPHHVAAALAATGASSWQQAEARLHELSHAPKLGALLQLLQQCGIADGGSPGEAPAGAAAGLEGREYAHRVLVFAQFKLMLDLVERDVLAPAGVPFLRLDGSVEASRRFGVVRQFNSDPSIPVMLLTTSVGGLGLNLTAADTVIFLEHDWNPMKDLQAMDRAHRLGQSRTVNVYRLLVKDSMEERVMSLQQFKTDVANAVINQENVSLTKMDTSKLLDIWGKPASGPPAAGQQAPAAGVDLAGSSQGLKSLLEGLEDLWDQSQYAEEFSLDTFAKKMG